MAPCRSSAAVGKALLVLAVLCLLVGSVSVHAANVVDFASAIQTALRSISPGFVTYYSALVGAPAVKAQYCTNSIVNVATGLTLTMESINAPYSVMATEAGLVVYKDNYAFGPTVELIGASYRLADATPSTTLQRGNTLTFPYTENSMIMVTGTITNGTSTSILPMARYMIVDAYLCSSMYADLTTFSSSLATLFAAFSAAAVAS